MNYNIGAVEQGLEDFPRKMDRFKKTSMSGNATPLRADEGIGFR
jgi:hypothetical protein